MYVRRAVFVYSDMKEEEQKTAEMNELNRLIGRGIKFKVNRKKFVRRPGWLGWIRKKMIVDEELEFEIHELTLSVLDRISAEGIMMEINEAEMKSGSGLSAAKRLVKDHSVRMAKVVAIAVLGEDYETAIVEHGRTRYIKDDKRLDEMTQLFAHTIKPSVLVEMCVAINTMSNLGDFTNCIRLTSASRTTIPDRVQE